MKSRRRPEVWTSRSKTASPPKLDQEKKTFNKQLVVIKEPKIVEEPNAETWESYRTDKLTITTTQKTEKKKSVQTKRSKEMPMNVTINLSDTGTFCYKLQNFRQQINKGCRAYRLPVCGSYTYVVLIARFFH